MRKNLVIFLLLLIFICAKVNAQSYTSSEIRQDLNKLNVLGSVLYLAAHPDDENTRVLSYMSRGRLMRSAYLSLTRGDGGQNLLGSEKGPLLGVIRTHELLAARQLDGAEQFFSRAIDFGYSKSAEETLNKWNREIILGDVVKVIRQFRPDVILTRFSTTQGGHGHHLASTMLAIEAYTAAADANRFPEQLDELEPWQVKRVMWNSWAPGPDAVAVEVGGYNPLLGQSYNEIASYGRSMHKSQGFGSAVGRDSRIEMFDLMIGDSAHGDIFHNIDMTWKRVENSGDIQSQINNLIAQYDDSRPDKSIPDLVRLYNTLNQRPDFWSQIKSEEVRRLIKKCSGLWLESIVWQEGISPGQEIDVRSIAIRRTDIPVTLNKVEITYSQNDSLLNKDLELYGSFTIKETIRIPENAPYTQPFWLRNPAKDNIFVMPDNQYDVQAKNDPALTARFHLTIAETPLHFDVPVRYRWTDAVKGEQYRPFIIRPALNVAVASRTYVFSGEQDQTVEVTIEAKEDNITGSLSLLVPDGWQLQPQQKTFVLSEAGEKQQISFRLKPLAHALAGTLKARARVGNTNFDQEIIDIEYDHIGKHSVLRPAEANLVKLKINQVPRKIGYIMGSGDNIPQALQQIGYTVELLSDEDVALSDLTKYDVIICGVRAFNTRKSLQNGQDRLNAFVEQGGTWIVQHNTRFGFQAAQIGPYPFRVTGRDRISQEDAPLQILMPEHPIFNYPNKITTDDFDGWVQERGLYFADSWEGKLYPLLAGNDSGEPAKLGGLLYAHYGKGVFIYTAFSWFRQLPAGVPGAYRLFVNMLSAEGKNER